MTDHQSSGGLAFRRARRHDLRADLVTVVGAVYRSHPTDVDHPIWVVGFLVETLGYRTSDGALRNRDLASCWSANIA